MSKSNRILSKPLLVKGLKYLALSLPLLFLSPIVVTMGFKSIKNGGNYFLLILGIIMTIFTILVVTQGIRLILKHLFNDDV